MNLPRFRTSRPFASTGNAREALRRSRARFSRPLPHSYFARDSTRVGNAFHLVTTKDLPYRDEREFRLVLWGHDSKNTQLQRASNGIRVPVDIGTLIERVYVNPLNQSIPENLLALLKSHKIAIDTSKLL